MGHTWKNGSHFEKWVTPGRCVTVKNGSHFEKCVTRCVHTLKNVSHVVSHVEKMGSHFEKWVTV